MRTLSQPGHLEEIVKRSRFLAYAAPVADEAAVVAWMASVRDPDATHNCWAWKIGERSRYSDDGEPGGTAGRPILAAIERAELDRVAVLVTRFFGGIKLGAGGLVRAYGGAAARCLRETPQHEVVPQACASVEVGFGDTGLLFGLLEAHGAERLEERYGPAGLLVALRLPARELPALEHALREATAGRVRLLPHQEPTTP